MTDTNQLPPLPTPQPAQATQAEVPDGIRPEDFTVDVVVKPMGGFAPVNTPGVRVTHKPTGISVTCDVARSQHANRNQAFEKLRAILSQQPDNTACKSVQKRLEAQRPATSEPVGYMNEGHIHELAMGRIPYGYVYPEAGAGASTAVYAHPAPSVPDDVVRDAERWRTFLATRPSSTHEVVNAAIDAAMLAAAPAAHPAPSVLKDDQIAALVNKVRDIARMFHDHQSLRERIAIELVPALKAKKETP